LGERPTLLPSAPCAAPAGAFPPALPPALQPDSARFSNKFFLIFAWKRARRASELPARAGASPAGRRLHRLQPPVASGLCRPTAAPSARVPVHARGKQIFSNICVPGTLAWPFPRPSSLPWARGIAYAAASSAPVAAATAAPPAPWRLWLMLLLSFPLSFLLRSPSQRPWWRPRQRHSQHPSQYKPTPAIPSHHKP